ncbi:WYL domain-containing protein [Paenibacillus sp. S02]|uniref:helix-turn-helix transcriptional regulator n=1 Tax=Paenibacillus sp. S02 TaxID=2823904 RepID=UPI001C651215|nr:WYL domain protein [Paenibacillus sp. S02]
MRLHRLIAILLCIESRGRMKAKELALALETSVRSIYRDIDLLAEAGVPIVTASGPKGGIYLMEGYTANLKQLNGGDVIQLYLTGMGIYTGGPTESGLKLKNALLKLEQTMPDPYQSDIKKAKARFYFDDTPWWTERIAIPCLESVRAAVWGSHKITIQYEKADGICSSRHVHPYGLVVKKGDWYLIAFCEVGQEIRTFKCERIKEVQPSAEVFEVPVDFSLEHHWMRQETAFKQLCTEKEYYPVLIRTNKKQAGIIAKRMEIIQSVQEGSHFILTVNMYSYEVACRDAMDWIGRVEVVEPVALRQFVKEEINRLQRIYG